MKLPEIERELGFRVTSGGIEILEYSIDEGKLLVKAVQPNLHRENAQKLWSMMVAQNHAAVLSKIDKDAWSARAFKDHERAEALALEVAALRNVNKELMAELDKTKSLALEAQRIRG